MKQKQPKPGKPDPSRFSFRAKDVVPMRVVEVIDMLTEEQKRDSATHDEALKQVFLKKGAD